MGDGRTFIIEPAIIRPWVLLLTEPNFYDFNWILSESQSSVRIIKAASVST